jgi:acetyl esterase/lipase
MRTGRRTIAAAALALSGVLAVAGCTPGVGLPPVETAAEATPTPEVSTPPSAEPSPSASAPPESTPEPGGAAAEAPGRAPAQTFVVASREVELARGGNRPLRTVVWYPSTGNVGANPADGVFPLVLFSHGLTATPESYQRLTTRIAAAGFIVAAPAYPYTNAAATTYNPADLINQPADASAVITGVLALNSTPGDPLAGHINTERVAAAGHSGGGYTTVGLLSGARDTRIRAAVVIAGGSLGGSFTGPPATVLFVHGDQDPIVTYGIGRSTYGMVPWPKAFLTITGGNHSSYLFTASTATTTVATSIVDFLRWTLYDDGPARTKLAGEAAVPAVTTFESGL